jgi:hypothetical protein
MSLLFSEFSFAILTVKKKYIYTSLQYKSSHTVEIKVFHNFFPLLTEGSGFGSGKNNYRSGYGSTGSCSKLKLLGILFLIPHPSPFLPPLPRKKGAYVSSSSNRISVWVPFSAPSAPLGGGWLCSCPRCNSWCWWCLCC